MFPRNLIRQTLFDRVAITMAVLVAAAIWITWPVVELGADDDWSYAKTALDLSRTGHIHYNGWATIMLGAQAYWGAAFIKLFGFSFTVLRLSMLPFAAGCVLMMGRICRRSNINPQWTIVLTLTVALSPVFVFCATNFSSDIPGFLAILLCADLAATTACTRDPRLWRKIFLLILLTVIGFIGGTTRQIVWGMPTVSLLYVAWARRRERSMVIASFVLLATISVGIVACESWYHEQPYSLPEYFEPMVRHWLEGLPATLVPLLSLVCTGALLMLPMTAGAWHFLRAVIGRLGIWGRVWMAAAVLAPMPLFLSLPSAVGPWLGNIVTTNGIDYRLDAIGENPQTLPLWLCVVLTLATFASLAAYACAVWDQNASRPRLSGDRSYAVHVRTIFTIFAIGYIGLTVMRSTLGVMLDRYLIPLMPVAGLWIAPFAQRFSPRMARGAWVILGMFTYFSLANTHDYFAQSRARLAAATAIEANGVQRVNITAGLSYDAWTQLNISGYVNDVRIENPPEAFRPHPRVATGGADFWYWEWTPSITPRFFVVNALQPDLVPVPLGPYTYTAWLPPFERAVYVQRKP